MDIGPRSTGNEEKITRRNVLRRAGELLALSVGGGATLTAGTPVLESAKSQTALKGINLGGWLVAERWMTPELFDGVKNDGERAIGKELQANEAHARISAHRDAFITEQDFKWISEHGFDFVRLPFGYWLLEEAEGYVSGKEYLTQAFTWASKHNLKVLLDFHGLQGSQNGNDHSGEAGAIGFYDNNNADRALSIVEQITRSYGHSNNLLGIEVINEPTLQADLTPLVDYYEQAYSIVAAGTSPEVKVVISDGFQHKRIIKSLGRRSFGDRLIIDTHLYQLFTDAEKDMSLNEHLKKVTKEWSHVLESELGGRALIGEWTAALPNKAVQGQDPMNALEAYYTAQRKVFDTHAWAHSFWSYKAPGSSWWSLKDLPFDI